MTRLSHAQSTSGSHEPSSGHAPRKARIALARPAERLGTREACEQLVVAELPAIRRLLASVARQRRLSAEDAEEFAATAILRLLADDYAVLRKFNGGSTLHTYLTVVFQRMCLDFLTAQWGKWRHSAASRREGPVALLLERLTVRDGLTFDEACEVLRVNHGFTLELESLARVFASFNRTRRRFVGESHLDDVSCDTTRSDQRVADEQHRSVLGQACDALAAAVGGMVPQDQLLLRLRFAEALSVAAVARIAGVDQKWLYRHYERLLGTLRRRLESNGIDRGDVAASLGNVEIDARVFPPDLSSHVMSS